MPKFYFVDDLTEEVKESLLTRYNIPQEVFISKVVMLKDENGMYYLDVTYEIDNGRNYVLQQLTEYEDTLETIALRIKRYYNSLKSIEMK